MVFIYYAWPIAGVTAVLFAALKYTIGVRVSATEELEGLDIHEHGMHAYPDINGNTYGSPDKEGVNEPTKKKTAVTPAMGQA